MEMMQLDRLYLGTLAAVAESVGLVPVLQQIDRTVCRLFLCAKESTRADVVLNIHFDKDECTIGVQMRSGAAVAKTLSYVDGLDEFVVELAKTLQARLLSASTSAKGRRAA